MLRAYLRSVKNCLNRPSTSKPAVRRTRLQIETLEGREMMSANVPGFTLSGGNLYRGALRLDTNVRDFAVSQDGMTVYALEEDNELVRIPAAGGNPYLVNPNVQSFAVAKDGVTLYVLYKHGELERRVPGVSAYLINPNVQSFALAPDNQTLYIQYRDGQLERRVPGVSAYLVNPGVRSFALVADGSTLYILYQSGELERRVPGVSAYLINPNVQSFVLAPDNRTLYILYKDGQLERRVPGVSAYLVNPNVQAFALAPGGNSLFILYKHGELERRVPGVSSCRIDNGVESFALAADGTLRVQLRVEQLDSRKPLGHRSVPGYLLDPAGNLYHNTTRLDTCVRDFAVSQDGNTVYVLEQNGNLVRIPASGGNSYLVNPNVRDFAVAEDGVTLYILYQSGELERRVPGVSAYLINPNVQSFVLAPDNQTLYIQYRDGQLERRVPGVSAYLVNPGVSSFALAADGSTLYIVYQSGELERRVPGVSAYLINPNVQSFVLAPDNRTLYILYKDGQLERRIPGVSAYLVNPNVKSFALAPDGHSLFILYKHGELERRVPGVSSQRIDSNVQFFALAADGSTLYKQFTDGVVAYTIDKTGFVELDVAGKLNRYTVATGWEVLDFDAVKCLIGPNGAVYSLGKDGWLNVDGRPMWTNTQDFEFDGQGTLYWLGTGGLLQKQVFGGWQDLDTKVAGFSLDASGNPVAVHFVTLTADGTLVVLGTEGNDSITVTQWCDKIHVILNGVDVSGELTTATVGRIEVFGRGGDDVINLHDPNATVILPTAVFGGAGNDQIFGGNGDDYLDGGDGNDYIIGWLGNDALVAGPSGEDWLDPHYDKSQGDDTYMVQGGWLEETKGDFVVVHRNGQSVHVRDNNPGHDQLFYGTGQRHDLYDEGVLDAAGRIGEAFLKGAFEVLKAGASILGGFAKLFSPGSSHPPFLDPDSNSICGTDGESTRCLSPSDIDEAKTPQPSPNGPEIQTPEDLNNQMRPTPTPTR